MQLTLVLQCICSMTLKDCSLARECSKEPACLCFEGSPDGTAGECLPKSFWKSPKACLETIREALAEGTVTQELLDKLRDLHPEREVERVTKQKPAKFNRGGGSTIKTVPRLTLRPRIVDDGPPQTPKIVRVSVN